MSENSSNPQKKSKISKILISGFLIILLISGFFLYKDYEDRKVLISDLTRQVQNSMLIDELNSKKESVEKIGNLELMKIYNQKLDSFKIKQAKNSEELFKIDKNSLDTENLALFNSKLSDIEKKVQETAQKEKLEKEKADKLKETLKNPKPLPEYKVVKRDADELKDNVYLVTGKIIQLELSKYSNDNTNLYSGYIRLDISNEEYGNELIYLEYFGEKPNIFEKDTKEFTLISTGTYTYESVAGYKITLPSFKAAKIKGQDIKIFT